MPVRREIAGSCARIAARSSTLGSGAFEATSEDTLGGSNNTLSSFAWSFNLLGSDDPSMTFSADLITIGGPGADLSVTDDITALGGVVTACSNSQAGTIEIYDSTLRDGTQAQGVSLSSQDKILIARALDRLGVDYIEGGYPLSNPKDEAFFADVMAGGSMTAASTSRQAGAWPMGMAISSR